MPAFKDVPALIDLLCTIAKTGGVRQVEQALTEMFYLQSTRDLSIELRQELPNLPNVAQFLANELKKAKKNNDSGRECLVEDAICDLSPYRIKVFADGSAFNDETDEAGKVAFTVYE